MRKIRPIKKELAVIAVAVLIYLFAGLLIARIIGLFCETGIIVANASYLIGALVTYMMASAYYERWEYGKAEPVLSWNSVKSTTFGIVGAFAVANVVAGITSIMTYLGAGGMITNTNAGSGYGELTGIETMLIVIVSALAVPMAEELIFRGLLLNALWKVFGLHKAVIISALCFGVLHGNSVMTVLSATLAGIVLAYTYSINRNLMDSIIPHVVYNTFVTHIAVNSTVSSETEVRSISESLQSALPVLILSLAVCGILIWLYKKYLFREENYEKQGTEMGTDT